MLKTALLAATLFVVAVPSPARTSPPPLGGAEAISVLNEIWQVGRSSIYPTELADRFNEETRSQIEAHLRENAGQPLADLVNPFLLSLGVSHTQLFDTRHHGYYMLRSLFATRDLDTPKLHVIGVQLDGTRTGRVRAVLDGLPAQLAGMQVGDRIISVNGAPFESLRQWQVSGPVSFVVESSGVRRELSLETRMMGLHRALLEATQNSARRYECEGSSVGYLHLWSGTHDLFLETLNQTVGQARKKPYGAFILDLRDGYGGPWWPYLDPFFPDRASYFQATALNREGQSEPMRAETRNNPASFDGPMAVLINNGTRSGKESLAWQFKKTGRARLFGTTTEGAFTAGRGVFADRDEPYMMYLSAAEYRLDEHRIEGVGVAPDVVTERHGSDDVTLEAALKYLNCGNSEEADEAT